MRKRHKSWHGGDQGIETAHRIQCQGWAAHLSGLAGKNEDMHLLLGPETFTEWR